VALGDVGTNGADNPAATVGVDGDADGGVVGGRSVALVVFIGLADTIVEEGAADVSNAKDAVADDTRRARVEI
jgi:hypothetical protein